MRACSQCRSTRSKRHNAGNNFVLCDDRAACVGRSFRRIVSKSALVAAVLGVSACDPGRQFTLHDQDVVLAGVLRGGPIDRRKPTHPLPPPDCDLVLEGEPRSFVHPGRGPRCETPIGTPGVIRYALWFDGHVDVFGLVFE